MPPCCQRKGVAAKGISQKSSKLIDKRIDGWYTVKAFESEERLLICGEMSERLKEPVLKTGGVYASVGSNPTLSATIFSCANSIGMCRSTQVAEGAPLLRE